jgi:hypothetical protein
MNGSNDRMGGARPRTGGRALGLLALFLSVGLAAHAQTYYVDFQNGSDSNAGTSTTAAWKTIPGTMNAANTAYISASYGGTTVTTTNKVPAGAVIRLRPGTTMSSANGGQLRIYNNYYATSATVANPVTIEAYQAWPGASGPVTFDGTGITLPADEGFGLIHVTVGGITFDGKVTDGIVIQNSPYEGICQFTSTQVEGVSAKYCKFFNNQVSISGDLIGSATGQIKILYARNGVVDHCSFDGNGRWGNGVLFGDSGKSGVNYTVSNSTFVNHKGSDDSGTGVKALNSQLTVLNCVFHNNWKGIDMGENGGGNVPISGKIVNCTSYLNAYWGFAVNGAGASSYTGATNFWFINDISYDNAGCGFYAYSGPFNVYFIHCVADGNGTNGSGADWANFMYSQDPSDGPIAVKMYNSISYKVASSYNMSVYQYWKTGTYSLSVDADYNDFRQRASENFMMWDFFGKSGQVTFTWATGPGGAGKTWYDWYDYNATQPPAGTGHYHADAHSVTSEPPFRNVAANDYHLTAAYPGVSLSSKSWYIPEMGVDMAGTPRTTWSMGAYESGTGGGPTAPAAPKNLKAQ